MSAATILFTDIVGFSKKPTENQKELINSLTNEIVHDIRNLLIPETGDPSVMALPTGDGMALAFLHSTDQVWNRLTILHLIVRLHSWAYKLGSIQGPLSLRIGIHVGPVQLVSDINGRTNICGDTVNYTQRVMDAANPEQTLFSDAAFREYVGQESPTCEVVDKENVFTIEFKGPIEVYAKHGLQILVYKLAINPAQEWWSNEDPVSKGFMLVTLTKIPKEIVGSFSERIASASQIAFVQLTGDRFLESLGDGKVAFSPIMNRFWVFMPDPEWYSALKLTAANKDASFVRKCIENWKKTLHDLKSSIPSADVKLGLFQEPPYLGASFVDWERPGGIIHVSPYVWNIKAPFCPGYDMSWIGRRPSPVYETYVRGLNYLNANTENLLL